MRGPSYTGRTLSGRYAVGELLGEGGWGVVYAAIQTDPHPKLDVCVIAALRQTKWPATPDGGSPQVSLSARTRDNP